MFSAVLILILLTEVVLYAVQTGVFEQRKSGNELRQKVAFHLADGAIQQAKQFLRANSVLVSSDDAETVPDGSGGWVGGWLAGGSQRWLPCSGAGLTGSQGTHPCFGEPVTALRDGMYYYSVDGSTELPLNTDAFTPDTTQKVRLYALLCMLNVDRDADPVVQGCTTDPALQDDRYYMVTLLARGEADCDTNRANCTAEALVAEKVGSFGPGSGRGADVPLTTRSTFPPTGTSEIVPNPNGGGLGVPMSAWMNANESCPNQQVVDPTGGSWSTCERHEWYGQDTLPDDFKCPTNTCSCSKDRKRLSYAEQGDQYIGLDLVADENFPCDLFEYMFGLPKSRYEEVKAEFTVIDDCSVLDETSFGLYWFTGKTCSVNANTQIGSARAPVFLVSAAETTRFNGGASLFGVLFITDVEEANATFDALGTMTIYGAAVVDGTLGQYNGTFQIVYVDSVLDRVLDTGGFGTVAGGWTDFHATWQ